MYNLNQFCNIIASLRKKKGWTQTVFAEKLGISPQSISKWECGIGYPDVTLFPVIAELLEVPIGTLFGDEIKFEEENTMNIQRTQDEYSGEFAPCKNFKVFLGNVCRVEWIEDQVEGCRVKAVGDPVFLRFLDVEQEGDTLIFNIKNPNGSGTFWEAYDREGYTGENYIEIHTVASGDGDICTENFLNLSCIAEEANERGNYQVACYPMQPMEGFPIQPPVGKSARK